MKNDKEYTLSVFSQIRKKNRHLAKFLFRSSIAKKRSSEKSRKKNKVKKMNILDFF